MGHTHPSTFPRNSLFLPFFPSLVPLLPPLSPLLLLFFHSIPFPSLSSSFPHLSPLPSHHLPSRFSNHPPVSPPYIYIFLSPPSHPPSFSPPLPPSILLSFILPSSLPSSPILCPLSKHSDWPSSASLCSDYSCLKESQRLKYIFPRRRISGKTFLRFTSCILLCAPFQTRHLRNYIRTCKWRAVKF